MKNCTPCTELKMYHYCIIIITLQLNPLHTTHVSHTIHYKLYTRDALISVSLM